MGERAAPVASSSSTTTSPTSPNLLPELWLCVFCWLPIRDIRAVLLCCKKWHGLLFGPEAGELWTKQSLMSSLEGAVNNFAVTNSPPFARFALGLAWKRALKLSEETRLRRPDIPLELKELSEAFKDDHSRGFLIHCFGSGGYGIVACAHPFSDSGVNVVAGLSKPAGKVFFCLNSFSSSLFLCVCLSDTEKSTLVISEDVCYEKRWLSRCAPLGVGHSEYYHNVLLTPCPGYIIITSLGSYGRWVEILDIYTGKSAGRLGTSVAEW